MMKPLPLGGHGRHRVKLLAKYTPIHLKSEEMASNQEWFSKSVSVST